jgi:lipase maturation factor 1
MFSPIDYTLICSLLPRLLGVIYFFAFGAFLFQIKGLLGTRGILPVSDYLYLLKESYKRKAYYYAPSLFWFSSTNTALMGVVALGTTLSLLLVFGVYPPFLLFLVYLLYLSIISVGQDFLSFGWEVFLQEVTLNALLLSLTPVPNLMVWISINFLLFRFYIQSGAVKFQSGDRNWRNLTAVAYHYQSQPIPNLTAWYVHKLPLWFHKLSCIFMFVVELIVPVLIFFSEEYRLFACACFVLLQFTIWSTGNFSYLNHLTTVFSLILLNNQSLEALGFTPPVIQASPLGLDLLLSLAGTFLLSMQVIRLWDHFFPHTGFRRLLNLFAPLHIANRYGIFAVMTTTRYEIVVEGSDDQMHWKEYLFYHKPTSLTCRPHRISPYQPRIDWQAWFLPFRPFVHETWFQLFLGHLLKGTPDVLTLIAHNPFSDQPPKYIRAVTYVYEFTSFEEKKKSKAWWRRSFVNFYTPTLFLKE